MKTVILAAGLVAMAGHASALSCMFGGGDVAFHQAHSNGEDFRAVIGMITWDLPITATYLGGLRMNYEGQEYEVAAQFRGDVMGAGGERLPIDEAIRVRTWCINGDCGYASDQGEMLTFLHDTPNGTIMNAYPCQSYPTGAGAENVALVQSCLDGGPCSSEMEY